MRIQFSCLLFQRIKHQYIIYPRRQFKYLNLSVVLRKICVSIFHHQAIHAYFTPNGRHDPGWPEFITDFIALPIYEHVHKFGKKFRSVRIMKTIRCKICMNCLLVAWYSGMLKRLTIVSMIAHKDRRVDRRTWFRYGMSFRSMLSKS